MRAESRNFNFDGGNGTRRIILLNPPSDKFIIRDYFCSHESKADYLWAPIDLLVLSGILRRHDLKIMDCVAERVNKESAIAKIAWWFPDDIISLVANIDIEQDMVFLKKLKEHVPAKLHVCGDAPYFDKDFLKKYPFVDSILKDFIPKNTENGLIKYGIPQHKLFPLDRYSMPYSRHIPVATILTSYGCPYSCTFCNSGKLPYRIRDMEEIITELKHLDKIGFKEVYIRDFTFTATRRRILQFCDSLKKNKINIEWSCTGRVDNVDKAVLKEMKEAGCYLIFFGIESASNLTLKNTEKGITVESIKEAIRMCREVGIKTLGSFIIGLPWETEQDILNTIKMSKKLGLDYASFNKYGPRPGATLQEMRTLPVDTLEKLHKKAVKEFYMRPAHIIKLFTDMRTPRQMCNTAKNAYSLIGGLRHNG